MYHYPKKEAAKVALNAIRYTIKAGGYKGNIILCCFEEEDAAIYKALLKDRAWKIGIND